VIHASERGARGRSYVLLTPANQYASRLAELPGAVVVKLVTPRVGPARFGQYLLDLPPGAGTTAPVGGGFEHFVFGLEGLALVSAGERVIELFAGGFAYVPEGTGLELRGGGEGTARLLWLKRRYEPVATLAAPGAIAGHRDDIAADPLPAPGLVRQELLPPGDPAFDFNMSLLRFAPGASLDRAEIHDEEHGLYMTAGEGVYLLDRERHEVRAGDFIYMAPYCPQSFACTGTEPAEYLLYKDVYRDGF
jgi:(S)-ureidoglycine aminohydrolase